MVIGGTGVLGGALAEGLAKAGATVVVAGRDPGQRSSEGQGDRGSRRQGVFAAVDVTKRESIEELLGQVLAEQGRVDMLINGAGVNNATPYFDIKDEDWDRVIESNLKAVHWGCQIFGRRWPRPAAARS